MPRLVIYVVGSEGEPIDALCFPIMEQSEVNNLISKTSNRLNTSTQDEHYRFVVTDEVPSEAL